MAAHPGRYLGPMVLLKKTADKREMTLRQPFGPGFGEHVAARAAVMEVHGSTLLDHDERCVFVLRDAAGLIIGEARIAGY